ncbi:MAG: hypothetical protein B6U87_00995 [Candidatus Aenigmarchaeota archaeon ex4484_52]|nr:MAG: hypothetical protein B6U87_00995 [Candidatus Aenigmarchaeota archaeon ex4484_52]
MKKFCPKCGKITKTFYCSLCETCYSKKFKTNIHKICKNVFVCNCGNLTHGQLIKKNISLNKFIDFSIEKELKKIFKKKYNDYKYVYIQAEQKKEEINKCILVKQNKITIAKYNFRFLIKNKMCRTCLISKSGYYEAILQLRGSEKFTKDISSIIEKTTDSSNLENSFIKIKKQNKNLANIEIGTKKLFGKIKKQILLRYKPLIKMSYSLHKIDDGKKIYKTTILIKEKQKNLRANN